MNGHHDQVDLRWTERYGRGSVAFDANGFLRAVVVYYDHPPGYQVFTPQERLAGRWADAGDARRAAEAALCQSPDPSP